MREPSWIPGVSVYECVSTSSNARQAGGKGGCVGNKVEGKSWEATTSKQLSGRCNTFYKCSFYFYTHTNVLLVSAVCVRDIYFIPFAAVQWSLHRSCVNLVFGTTFIHLSNPVCRTCNTKSEWILRYTMDFGWLHRLLAGSSSVKEEHHSGERCWPWRRLCVLGVGGVWKNLCTSLSILLQTKTALKNSVKKRGKWLFHSSLPYILILLSYYSLRIIKIAKVYWVLTVCVSGTV